MQMRQGRSPSPILQVLSKYSSVLEPCSLTNLICDLNLIQISVENSFETNFIVHSEGKNLFIFSLTNSGLHLWLKLTEELLLYGWKVVVFF